MTWMDDIKKLANSKDTVKVEVKQVNKTTSSKSSTTNKVPVSAKQTQTITPTKAQPVKTVIENKKPTVDTFTGVKKDKDMTQIVDGVVARNADGSLTDYGKMLENQNNAQTIASNYKKPTEYKDELGMYGGLKPTYEAYVAENVAKGNNVVSEQQWAESISKSNDKYGKQIAEEYKTKLQNVNISSTSPTYNASASTSPSGSQITNTSATPNATISNKVATPTFDINIDYGTAIKNAKTPQEKALLETARQAKIDAMKNAGFDPATQGGAFKQWYLAQQQSKANSTITSTFDDTYITSEADRIALANAKQKYANAKTQAEKDSAHAEAEAIRAKYNYSGGGDGSKYISLNASNYVPNNTPSEEVNAVQAKIDEYIDNMTNQATSNADLQYNQTVNLINQQLASDLASANVDVQSIISDYQSKVASVDTAKYDEIQQQKVDATSRGILQSQQQLGLEQGINARAESSKSSLFQSREEKISEIQNRIANIRAKATTDIANANLQRQQTINTAIGQINQNQLNQMNNIQLAEINQQNNMELKQYDTQSAILLKQMEQKYDSAKLENIQAHDKEMLEQQFNNDLAKMATNQIYAERLQKLDFQDKVALMQMDAQNQRALVAMDNQAKLSILGAETAIKQAFFNADAQLQKDLMNLKGNIDSENLSKELTIKALQETGGTFALLGNQAITTSQLNQVSDYYMSILNDMKKAPGSWFGIGPNLKIATLESNPSLANLLKNITGKTSEQLTKMKPEDVTKLLENYSKSQLDKDVQTEVNKLKNYKSQVQTTTNYFK